MNTNKKSEQGSQGLYVPKVDVLAPIFDTTIIHSTAAVKFALS